MVLLGLAGWWWSQQPRATAVANTSLTQYLIEETAEGFAQALEPNAVVFPRAFGAHEEYQTEWWYYTGHLQTAEGRRFGYQFTIFRRALTPPNPNNPTAASASAWRSNQVYFAHFAISDIAADQFYAFERFSRGGAGLAGATAVPYAVWLEDWGVAEQPDGTLVMRAAQEGVALELVLTQTRPPILHGRGGLSQKGNTPGNASYYYSQINQTSVGRITINGQTHDVRGHSWKDHEYSTSALEQGAVGWDWFSLQFDNPDQNALMLFQIRRDDGSLQPQSGGSWVTAENEVVALGVDEFELEVLAEWRSPTSGAVYPAGWRLRIPRLDLALEGRPLMANQELNVSTTYWEGAVQFTGTLAGQPVSAVGYVEMTGYGRE